jgi:transcriptional regulator with XRE-family HTH domain
MNIGEKIKNMRRARRMTQAELAGEMITRNMLSRIENGSALPSVPTLTYLAEKLGVPAGYFLAEESMDFHYLKMTAMPDILRAYGNGEYEICRDMCRKLGGQDDEIIFLVCLCTCGMARAAFADGDLHEACELFDETCRLCEATAYPTAQIKASALAYLDFMNKISPSFYSEQLSANEDTVGNSDEPFVKYCVLMRAFEENAPIAETLARAYLARNKSEADGEDVYLSHINAKLLMNAGDHREAACVLRVALTSGEEMPAPVMYFIFSDLERACKELLDYKGAYEYSNGKIALMEKFLR